MKSESTETLPNGGVLDRDQWRKLDIGTRFKIMAYYRRFRKLDDLAKAAKVSYNLVSRISTNRVSASDLGSDEFGKLLKALNTTAAVIDLGDTPEEKSKG